MFESITTPLKIEATDALNYLIIAAALAVAAMVGFMFGAVAVFMTTFNAYGSLYAALAEIGYCLVVLAVMVVIILVSRSRARRRAVARAEAEEVRRRREKSGAPPAWKDMGVVATALPIAMKAAQLGLRNKTALGLVAGGMAAGWAAWQASKSPPR